MKREVLIKFGEFFLKKGNRFFFENALVRDIKCKIKKFGNFSVCSYSSFAVIASDCDDALDILISVLPKIFGISSFSPALFVEKELDLIKNVALNILQEHEKRKTFKIETKRSDKKFFLNSMQISCEVGEFLVNNSDFKVDVSNPDITINIELREKGAYLHSKTFKGLGGLPSGTGGRCAVLLSGGIDSPVAFFLMAKKGLDITCIHFETPPYTSEASVLKVRKIVRKLSEYKSKIKLYIVNFTKIQENINKHCSKELFTIISRRIMNRIAQEISLFEKCSAVVTGESLGQVASQTLSAMFCTNESINLPILRPLITFDKCEIIDIAKKIGTFEISIEPHDDCCSIFSPKHPKINPVLKFVKINEQNIENLDILIEDCVKNCKIFEY
ncbi:MAG: tRNA 4-thiouridine(8) synthase ThiI [Candidatus Improbicoccus pseudotrichonymphae]|uniref:Probable tRNA sulfurtransferase n=1 Tax=Candidatus Improbicoccus pseudotrichonymphae TaxID=3033792 RepID=A0AA48KWX1_9FIRM|nr:MAG: tRNA 4-thiouridine(8) synthase ThiI [Candidatus Improbicoccus pseudotrichonymphae]